MTRRRAIALIVVVALAVVVGAIFLLAGAGPRTYTIDCGYVNDAIGHDT